MIETRNLTKLFGQKVAVDGVSLTVEKGEVLGFLGPNAAGKSTTMRMITGFLPPTSGTALVGGYDVLEDSIQARKLIGYLPENAPVYHDMTVMAFLDFIAWVRGFSGAEKSRRIERTIERCFLDDVRYQTISTLSKGFKQRVCFAQSILHDPPYLIMDEPTDGLDPNQKHEVRGMIREMARSKTLLISTHNLEEVDAVCTRVVIIADGAIVADDTPQRLKARSSMSGAVSFTVKGEPDQEVVQGIESAQNIKSAEVLEKTGAGLKVRVYPEDPATPIADRIVPYFSEKGYSVESLFVEEGRLDEVFRMITLSR